MEFGVAVYDLACTTNLGSHSEHCATAAGFANKILSCRGMLVGTMSHMPVLHGERTAKGT